jgi:hypothetical protein
MSQDDSGKEEPRVLDSDSYESDARLGKRLPGWIKVGAIAAASAVAGGLAAAWFYRHTLSRLRQADQNPSDSNFGIAEERTQGED